MKTNIALIIAVAIAAFVVDTLHSAGSFKTLEPHSKLSNTFVYTNMAGTEDIEINPARGLLFISSSDRWNPVYGDQSKDGIYVLDLNVDSSLRPEPTRLDTTYNGEFHPHGMSFINEDGLDYLFVVNHNQKGNFVELFEFKDNLLIHLKSFKNTQMCCPNDVVAVDKNRFYVSNDHGASTGLKRAFEEYLRLANSYILYFDGKNFAKSYGGLVYANGINVSADGKTVYVTETTGGKISVLDRDIDSGQLTLRFTKTLETGLDNINIDADDSLWIGSHPKLFDFVGHAENTGEISPSQVLKLTHDGNSDFAVTEVYLDSGSELSGSSSALYYNGTVYVGVVFENKLLLGTF
jgi:arylesterase/paraoxonase